LKARETKLFLQDTIGRLSGAIADLLARQRCWTPLSKDVTADIDDSDDSRLIGRRLCGKVRAFDPTTGMLLLHLVERFDYEGRYTARDVDIIVTTPAVRSHRTNRLLLTWSAVRIVDASSFALQSFSRTIATGRLALDRRR
jgi:hypothetical protein